MRFTQQEMKLSFRELLLTTSCLLRTKWTRDFTQELRTLLLMCD